MAFSSYVLPSKAYVLPSKAYVLPTGRERPGPHPPDGSGPTSRSGIEEPGWVVIGVWAVIGGA
jgi:hypothetical protein